MEEYMKKGFAALAAVAAVVAFCAPAQAETFTITNFDGSFGSFSTVVNGDFDHSWTWDVPADGLVSGSVTAARVSALAGITFSLLTLNGQNLENHSAGNTQNFSLDDLFATVGTQTLRLVGSGHGSYGGSISYAAFGGGGNENPVPEPATWALMLGGFGVLGMAVRRQRKPQVTYA
jgi:hypothetical protein